MSFFWFVFSLHFLFSCVSFGDGRKLRMAVDRDAWQVVSDDLINCKDKGEGKELFKGPENQHLASCS